MIHLILDDVAVQSRERAKFNPSFVRILIIILRLA